MVTTPKLKENYSKLKEELKKKFPSLNEADLSYSEGKDDEFIEKVRKKLGKTKEEVTNSIEEIQSNFNQGDEKSNTQPENIRKEGQNGNSRKDGQTENSRRDGQVENARKDGQTENASKDGQTEKSNGAPGVQAERNPSSSGKSERKPGNGQTSEKTDKEKVGK